MGAKRRGSSGYSFMGCLLSVLLFITASLLLVIVMEKRNNEKKQSPPPTPPPALLQIDETTKSREEISRLFEKEITPLIENAHKENSEARDRAIQTLREDFNGFREGVPTFVASLTSWGTRAGIVSNWTKDTWNTWWNNESNANQLGEYINSKFREEVLSEDKLKKAFEDSIAQFTTDLAANRNALLSEITIVLSSDNIPVTLKMPEDQLADFVGKTQKYYSEQAKELAQDSVFNLLLASLAGEAAAAITIRTYSIVGQVSGPIITAVMTPITISFTSQVASMGIATAGSTASFAAAGAAGGTTVGPLGTGVGILVGLVVGGLVDWWISAKFEQEATEKINAMLGLMEEQIIKGVSNDEKVSMGLEAVYSEANLEMKRLMRQAMLQALYERGSS